jgi:hypothetical protein
MGDAVGQRPPAPAGDRRKGGRKGGGARGRAGAEGGGPAIGALARGADLLNKKADAF